jgi:hypothetical protein
VCLSAALWVGLSHQQKAVAQPASDPVIAAAGDIACAPPATRTSSKCHQQATANLLTAGGYDAVLPLGDTQYECGQLSAFQAVYDPTWGQVKSISHPARRGQRIRRLDLLDPGRVRLLHLLRRRRVPAGRALHPGLQGLLQLRPGQLAHHRAQQRVQPDRGRRLQVHLTAGQVAPGQPDRRGRPPQPTRLHTGLLAPGVLHRWWRHVEQHELFRQDPLRRPRRRAARRPQVRLRAVRADGPLPGGRPQRHPAVHRRHWRQESWLAGNDPAAQRRGARPDGLYGVLRPTLHAGSYDWQFLPEAGKTFTDSGTQACHNAPSP